MFDHWTILQFLEQASGNFNVPAMQEGIRLATSDLFSNHTLKIKGWPGPIVHQRDIYPAGMKSPKTPAEFQQAAGDRFNSELALFLAVASERDFWIYSWFWGWNDYVPADIPLAGGGPPSTVPAGFYTEAKCPLGKPLGPATRSGLTYMRKFEHASVFADLSNRTASKVVFTSC